MQAARMQQTYTHTRGEHGRRKEARRTEANTVLYLKMNYLVSPTQKPADAAVRI